MVITETINIKFLAQSLKNPLYERKDYNLIKNQTRQLPENPQSS